MISLRAEKTFIRVLNALAELEALSSNDAFARTEAWVARLQRRLDRYLTLTAHHQPPSSPAQIRALLWRVKEAIARGNREGVFSGAAQLRDQLTADFRALQADRHSAAP